MLRLDGEGEPEIILGTPFDEHTGMLSPDDRWLAYVSNESGREEVYVCSFPDFRRQSAGLNRGRHGAHVVPRRP